MKFVFYLGLLLLLINWAAALPANPTDALKESLDFAAEQPTGRYKRATCDLLSYFDLKDSACAAHCVAIGRSGGYCNSKKVCVCR